MKRLRWPLILVLAVLAFSIAGVAQNSATKPSFTIAGVVVDNRSSQPLANTNISIASVGVAEQSRSVITGEDGRFSFTGLARGKYSLVGKRRGYLAQAYDQHEQYSSAIAVGGQQDASHLVFRLHPDASIHGKITDEFNEPVRMQVWLFSTRNDVGRRSTRVVSQTQSNDLGEYSFAHLGEGTYYLLAMGRPWYASDGAANRERAALSRNQQEGAQGAPLGPEHDQIVDQEFEQFDKTYPLTFYDNAGDWTQASGIDLAPGDHFTADFRVNAVASATLRLGVAVPEQTKAGQQGGMGMGMRFPRVLLQAKVFDDQEVTVNVNYGNMPDGTFFIGGIPPGHYILQARLPNDDHATTQEIDISGDVNIPKLAPSANASVSGKFVWDGTPMTRGFGVILTNSRTNRNYFCRPNPDGGFSVAESVLPGKYELSVGSQRGDVYVKSIEIGGVTSTSTVQIPAGGEAKLTVTLGYGGGTIEGVALLDGKPKAGVMVVLVPANGWVSVARFRRDQSDSDGTFTLRNVVPGSYKVVALKDGWKLPWSDPKTMRSYLTEGTSVQITSNEKPNITVKVK
jgi:hypothetical protein